jgi:PAS domain S-box-containing protein
MNWEMNLYAAILLAAGLISLGLSAFGWTRRRNPGGWALAVLMAVIGWWSFNGAVEAAVIAPAAKILAAKFQYLGIASVAPLWLLFALTHGQRLARVSRRAQALLWLEPIILVVLAFTNERHNLIWTSIRPVSDRPGALLVYGHGPAVWAHLIFAYALIILATSILVRDALKLSGVFRKQTIWLLAGAALPWLGNAVYMFRIGPAGLDLTPLAFMFAGGCLAVSLLRYRLLDVVPIAHVELFARMADSVLVLDPENRVLDLNPAARRLIGAPADVIGRSLLDLLAPWPDFAALAPGLLGRGGEEIVQCPVIKRWLDVQNSELRDARGAATGRLVVLRDITPLKAAEEERFASLERIGRQQQAVVALTVNPALTTGEFEAAAAALTEAAGTTMEVERTSVWLGSYEDGRIRCADLFERTPARHSSGTILPSARYPVYFAAVAAGRVIAAEDAGADARTSEFREDYLVPLGISSMLDAPIRAAGVIRGIVCFEHIGPVRAWRIDEIRFAGEIADQTAQALLNADRREAAEALRRREERLRFISDNQLDMLCQFDAAGIAVYVSPSVERILGYPYRHMLGRRADEFIQAEDFPAVARALQEARQAHRRSLRLEYRFRHADGSFLWLESEVLLYDDAEGRPAGSIISSRDMTQRRRAEEALRESIREKEVLLKEVHHRVRNNMQVISSLLNLQARELPTPALRELFRESQNRIKALALVHEKLYRSSDLSRIDFADYAQSLVVHLFHILQADPERIRFEPQLEPIVLDIGLSIPLGLVINELVSNVLRHAFPDGRRGALQVRLERTGAGRGRLIVRDDGVGWAGAVDPQARESLGIQIVQTLVKQIDGTLTFGREGGTAVEVEFPLPA